MTTRRLARVRGENRKYAIQYSSHGKATCYGPREQEGSIHGKGASPSNTYMRPSVSPPNTQQVLLLNG